MRHDDGDLDAQTHADAAQGLVADPVAGRRADGQRVHQARADRRENGAEHDERDVVARHGDPDARGYRHEGDAEDVGEVADAGLRRRDARDDLEVDREVVEEEQEGARVEDLEAREEGKGLLLHEPRYDERAIVEPDFDDDEEDDDEAEADQHAYHVRRVPWFLDATPLQREDQADHRRHQHKRSEQVHLQELFERRGLLRLRGLRCLEEEKDEDCRSTADGQVDIKAPAPGEIVGEDAAQHRADDRGDGISGSKDARIGRRLLGRRGKGEEGVSA